MRISETADDLLSTEERQFEGKQEVGMSGRGASGN